MEMSRGVTIIKLLIILVVIILIIAIAYIGLGITQQQSRDVRRMSDMNALEKALALYQTSNDTFPISPNGTAIDGTDLVSKELLISESMTEVPKDPLHPEYSYTYSTNLTGTDFTIKFCLEGSSIPGYTTGCNNYITP